MLWSADRKALRDATLFGQQLRIDHIRSILIEILCALLVFIPTAGFMWAHGMGWKVLLWGPVCMAAWVIYFRVRLNKRRGHDWWYMGPMGKRTKDDSMYDGVWHWLAKQLIGSWRDDLSYKPHEPALLAFPFEATVLVLCAAMSM